MDNSRLKLTMRKSDRLTAAPLGVPVRCRLKRPRGRDQLSVYGREHAFSRAARARTMTFPTSRGRTCALGGPAVATYLRKSACSLSRAASRQVPRRCARLSSGAGASRLRFRRKSCWRARIPRGQAHCDHFSTPLGVTICAGPFVFADDALAPGQDRAASGARSSTASGCRRP
jgi:hypothetical protein